MTLFDYVLIGFAVFMVIAIVVIVRTLVRQRKQQVTAKEPEITEGEHMTNRNPLLIWNIILSIVLLLAFIGGTWRIGQQIDSLNSTLKVIASGLKGIASWLNGIDSELKGIDGELNSIEWELKGIDGELYRIKLTLDSMK